jgi:hypothetical protein
MRGIFSVAGLSLGVMLGTHAGAAIVVVNSAAAFGPSTAISFDTSSSDTIAEVATNFGVTIASADVTAHSFVTGPGSFSGIGFLASNAIGNSRNGLISDVSQAPNYSGSTFRAFDISFAEGVSHFGLTVQGFGHNAIPHSFELFDAADSSLGIYLFAAAGLVGNDNAPNGFAGFISDGAAIKRVRVTPSAFNEDFVAFDDLTFVTAPAFGGVPEPASWALLVAGFGLVGSALRSRQRVEAAQA